MQLTSRASYKLQHHVHLHIISVLRVDEIINKRTRASERETDFTPPGFVPFIKKIK